MEYCILKGLIAVLLIQRCTSEGLSTSILPSTVSPQDGQVSPQEPEVVPAVAPPSLKEVQQAVQEATEQVDSGGAEEVLKELLERVMEAALSQAEGGNEARVDEAGVEKAAEEDGLGAEKGDDKSGADTNADVRVLEQATEEAVGGGDEGATGGDAGGGEEQELAEEIKGEGGALEDGEGVVEEGETAAESVEEAAVGGEAAEGDDVTRESPVDVEISQDIVEEAVARLDETGGVVTVEEAGGEENGEKAKHSEAKKEIQEMEETPAVVEVVEVTEPEQETVLDPDYDLEMAHVEQIGDALEVEPQVVEAEGGVILPQPPSDDHEKLETTQTVIGEPAGEEGQELVQEPEGDEAEMEKGLLVIEGGADEETEGVDAEGGDVAGGEGEGEIVMKEESEALVNGEVDQQWPEAAGEEKIALEQHGGETVDREVLVIPAPEAGDGAAGGNEAFIEDGAEKQTPTHGPATGGGETERNTFGDDQSNHANEIITATNDLLPPDPVETQPVLDNFVKDGLAVFPQSGGEEPGEANELVEEIAGTTETAELGLEAWKIGAIAAAVLLVLESVVIVIYILKCRNKSNSTPALQRACEEGCVEPEATTGGDCSDDTLPAGNGDTQQMSDLDPSDVASTLARDEEQHEEQRATPMSDLPANSTEESANTGPGPDSTQDLRTSIL